MVILSPKLDNEVSKNHPFVGFNLGRFLTDFEFSESFGKKTQRPFHASNRVPLACFDKKLLTK